MKGLSFNLLFDGILLKGCDTLVCNFWSQETTPRSCAAVPKSVVLMVRLAASLGEVEPLLLWGLPLFFAGVKGRLVQCINSCEGWWWQWNSVAFFLGENWKKSFSEGCLAGLELQSTLGLWRFPRVFTTDEMGAWWVQEICSWFCLGYAQERDTCAANKESRSGQKWA